MPSIGQWFLAYKGCGANFTNGNFDDKAAALSALNKLFADAGLQDYELLTNEDYYSTTQFDRLSVWSIGQKNGVTATMMYEKDLTRIARLFVSFEIKK